VPVEHRSLLRAILAKYEHPIRIAHTGSIIPTMPGLKVKKTTLEIRTPVNDVMIRYIKIPIHNPSSISVTLP
jgi:hypothetical protein